LTVEEEIIANEAAIEEDRNCTVTGLQNIEK
jgi:hypothetical protein